MNRSVTRFITFTAAFAHDSAVDFGIPIEDIPEAYVGPIRPGAGEKCQEQTTRNP